MKKLIPGVIALVMLFAMNSIAVAETSVVATIFPVYDWVREVAGDDVDLTLLLDNGVDLHSYQPTAQDIMKVATCDMFVYVGGESDDWVEDALSEAVNPDMVVVNLVEAMGEDIKMEEIVEGMEREEDEHEADAHEDHEDEADEHVWLSLRNAQKLVKAWLPLWARPIRQTPSATPRMPTLTRKSWPRWTRNTPPCARARTSTPCSSATASPSAIWWTTTA